MGLWRLVDNDDAWRKARRLARRRDVVKWTGLVGDSGNRQTVQEVLGVREVGRERGGGPVVAVEVGGQDEGHVLLVDVRDVVLGAVVYV